MVMAGAVLGAPVPASGVTGPTVTVWSVGKLKSTPGAKSTPTLSTVTGPLAPGGSRTVMEELSGATDWTAPAAPAIFAPAPEPNLYPGAASVITSGSFAAGVGFETVAVVAIGVTLTGRSRAWPLAVTVTVVA